MNNGRGVGESRDKGKTGINIPESIKAPVLAVVSCATWAPGDVVPGRGGTLEEAKQLPEAWRQGGTELNLPFAAHALGAPKS